MQDIAVTTSRDGLSKRGLSRRDLDLGSTASHTDHRGPCSLPLVRYDSGMTSPFSQLCFRSIVHDIAAALSRRPVCYHTFAKSLRFTRHHTQLPFEMLSLQGTRNVRNTERRNVLPERSEHCPPPASVPCATPLSSPRHSLCLPLRRPLQPLNCNLHPREL